MAVPSLVLVALGVLIVFQQEELSQKRDADSRRLLIGEFERALSARLERLREEPDHSMVALVADVDAGRLVLPWERVRARVPAESEAFSRTLTDAEREEFVTGRLDRAATSARAALARAASPQHMSRARLQLARVAAKRGDTTLANATYAAILSEPLSSIDEAGVPFALYAAERLVSLDVDTDTQRSIARVVDTAQSIDLSPVALYALQSIAQSLTARNGGVASSEWSNTIARRIGDVEHALALQRDYSRLEAPLQSTDRRWVSHGHPLWLVSSSGPAPGSTALVAVRADEVVASIHTASDSLRSITLASGGAERLGDRFPELNVQVAPGSPDTEGLVLQRAFYSAALAVVLAVTFVGAWLLWRDVRREVQIAELRSQFVASVSHELKTPLTSIRMFADTLREERVTGATRGEYLDTIVGESERLTRLLDNVLHFSKIERGVATYHLEPVSLRDIVRVAARAMAFPLAQHGFSLRVTIDESVPDTRADADALQQAILNLLNNAMKYSGTARDIDLSLSRVGDEVVVSVRDAGVGIPANEHARLFDQFYRVRAPENEHVPGAGLGLTLVAHIAQAHDGRVTVESAPGLGSTFAIYLPLAGARS